MFRKSSQHSEGLVAHLSLIKDMVCYKDIGNSLRMYGVISDKENGEFLELADSEGNTSAIRKLIHTLETR